MEEEMSRQGNLESEKQAETAHADKSLPERPQSLSPDRSPWSEPVMAIAGEVATAASFTHARLREIPRDGDTEDLLNGLIAECHFLMREVALPSATQVRDATTRMQFLNTAMSLAKTGGRVGRTIAKLRGAGSVTELHQRHIVEQVVITPAPHLENGSKT